MHIFYTDNLQKDRNPISQEHNGKSNKKLIRRIVKTYRSIEEKKQNGTHFSLASVLKINSKRNNKTETQNERN